MAGGSLRFTPCDSGEGRTIEDDATGSGAAVLQELGGGGSDPGIPVMLRLEETRLQEVRYAAPEGAGCERLPPEGELEARGNEPFWHLRVDGPRAWFRTPETPDGVEFASGGWSRPTPGRWLYQAERKSEAGAERLTLELSAKRCKDGMSGAWYPYAAAMMRGGTRLEGCALEGRKAFTDLPP